MLLGFPDVRRNLGEIFRLKSLICLKKCLKKGKEKLLMAKDGTNRGGARPGAGRKKKALSEKIAEGNPGHRPLTMIDSSAMESVDMPPPSDYLSAMQRDGKPLGADLIYIKVFEWLKAINCEKLVSPNMVEQYAICVSRWVQCEEAISKLGFIGKNAKTGAPMQSPFVSISQAYMKQANVIWADISQIVKENCSVEVKFNNPENDMMESLLRRRNN